MARVVRASCYRYCLWRPGAASVWAAIQRQGVVTDTDAVARPLIISSRLLSVFCELTNDTDPSLSHRCRPTRTCLLYYSSCISNSGVVMIDLLRFSRLSVSPKNLIVLFLYRAYKINKSLQY